MPQVAVSQTMLVNRGLRAFVADGLLDDAEPSASPFADVQRLATSRSVTFTDAALAGVITGWRNPEQFAQFAIDAKHAELGGAAGPLGAVSGGLAAVADGFQQQFKKGAIYWRAQHGAHALFGPIAARWRALGGIIGSFGFPVSDVHRGGDPWQAGWVARFAGGSIYWVPPAAAPAPITTAVAAPARGRRLAAITLDDGRDMAFDRRAVDTNLLPALTAIIALNDTANTFEVHGAIHAKYLALGAEASFLGYPRTDETGTPDGVGRYNHFQSGSIYWTPQTGAHEVHGLIRDLWASKGWERNPALGYPISDELIPARQGGFRIPETRRKPLTDVPPDVIKLPEGVSVNADTRALATAAAATTGRVAAGADTRLGTSVTARGPATVASAATATPAHGAVADLASMTLSGADLTVAAGLLTTPEESRNRFSDFESGVLFWHRNATAAIVLSPRAKTKGGVALGFTGAEVAGRVLALFGGSFGGNNMTPAALSFTGVTGCSHDGVQTHNRRHRLVLSLLGTESAGPFGLPHAVTAAVELKVEVWLEPLSRRINCALVEWSLANASSAGYRDTVARHLRARLDPLLWSARTLATLPLEDDGKPMTPLSVKTLADGSVATFVEPEEMLTFLPGLIGAFTPVVIAVPPSR